MRKTEPVGPQHSEQIQQQARDLLAPFQGVCPPERMPILVVLWAPSTEFSGELE